MTAIVRLRRSDFDQLDSPEHQDWKRHRQLLLRIPSRDVWRGCLGLALLTTQSDGAPARGHSLVPDRLVRWVSLVDLPHGRFRRTSPREVHWASVHRTLIDHGMPTLTGVPEAGYDFRAIPFDRIRRGGRFIEAGPDVLNPSQQPGLFRALNALNWAMTRTAFVHRAAWRARRDDCFEALGAGPCSESPIQLYGEKRYDHAVRPAAWMPRAYLGFREFHRNLLFDRATDSHRPRGGPSYPGALRAGLCADFGLSLPVRAPCSGTFLGAVPSAFHGLPTLDLIFERRRERVVIHVTRTARLQVRTSEVVREGDLVAHD